MRSMVGESGPLQCSSDGLGSVPAPRVRDLAKREAGATAVQGSPTHPAVSSKQVAAIRGPICSNRNSSLQLPMGGEVRLGGSPAGAGEHGLRNYWGIDPSMPST